MQKASSFFLKLFQLAALLCLVPSQSGTDAHSSSLAAFFIPARSECNGNTAQQEIRQSDRRFVLNRRNSFSDDVL